MQITLQEYTDAPIRSYDRLSVTCAPITDFSANFFESQPAVIAKGNELGILQLGMIQIVETEVLPVLGQPDPRLYYVWCGAWFDSIVGDTCEYPQYPDLFKSVRVHWGDWDQTYDVSTFTSTATRRTYDQPGTYDVRVQLNFADNISYLDSNPPSATTRIIVP